MVHGDVPTSHARARQLFEKRREVLVHPISASADEPDAHRCACTEKPLEDARAVPDLGWYAP